MQNKNNYWLLFSIALKFIVQYLISGTGNYDLQRDEYLHLDQARHLAWGFQSVPPFTSWISWIIMHLGNSVFWIRFFPALFGAATIALVWKTVEALNGRLFALVVSAIALIFSSLLRLNLLYQPNSADIFFWTLLLFAVVKYIRTGQQKWLYVAAISFGLGFLNKYNIVFCIAGLFPALLLTKQRIIFLKRHFYFAMLSGILILLPNLLWQYNHHFPVLAHMQELKETQLEKVPRMEFVKEQIMLFFSALIVIIASFVSFFAYGEFKKYRFLFFTYIITMAIFIVLRAKGYYAFGIYPIFFAFGTVYLEHLLQHGWTRFLRPVLVLILLTLFVPVLLTTFPLKSPAQFYEDARQNKPFSKHTWEDGKSHPISQDFADMLGWKELAVKTDSIYATLPDKANTLIITNNYGQAGAINYYSKFKEINAVSFNADYLNWFNFDQPVHNVIRVITKGEQEISDKQKAGFTSVTETGRINNTYAREFGTRIYLMKGAKFDIRPVIKKEMERH